ncbi:MAG: CPBP family intramembrane metalloprotease [Phycisphaerae bacterium]|nr:CPBP family intramembrane metalloprotease [Phycisphaerae bacterium]
MRLSRVSAIFRKELTDIVRDRRTLIGMVVVPIILYPALILTFGPAHIGQTEAMRHEPYVIVVQDAKQGRWLEEIIRETLTAPDPNHPATTSSAPASSQAAPHEAELPRVVLLDKKAFSDPNQAVRASRDIHVGVTLSGDPNACREGLTRLDVRLAFDSRDPRSIEAMRRAEAMLYKYGSLQQQRLRRQMVKEIPAKQLDERLATLLDPVSIEAEPVTAGSVFLQIMPVILVLMTVTGAIYPAIDLTAGERERGTLETLMVAPVPTLEIVTGKFLVVIVVSLITALLNVISIGASVRLIHVEQSVNLPIGHLVITLLAIIPLSMLAAAALIAVCSFARSFKESQNYVMPVVIAAVIPAIMGTLPGTTLTGATRVVPIENIVVLVRDLATRDTVPWTDVAIVLLSTCLYAGGAIAVASRLFGHEAVTFADAGSYRTLFRRQFFRPSATPTAAQALLTVAVLFPIWFHVQGLIGSTTETGQAASFVWLTLLMVPTLALPVVLLSIYLKVDLRNTFSLRAGNGRGWLAALLIGLGSWAVAIKLQTLQESVLPIPETIRDAMVQTDRAITDLPLLVALLCVGVLPAVCEETLFRGFLLAGLRSRLRKGWALVGVAVVFALYHALIYRFAITALLGLALAYLCWQSRSILPCMLVHAMHNGVVVLISRLESLRRLLRMEDVAESGLPAHVWIPACVLVLLGAALLVSVGTKEAEAAPPPSP